MINLTDDLKAYQLYAEIKEIILSKNSNQNYIYKAEQYLGKRDIEEETKSKYFSEQGIVEFENIDGDNVTVEISRWHNYKRWSRYGIYEVPSFKAEIYVNNQIAWRLCSYCRDSLQGECSETEVSSLEIPYNILQERQLSENVILKKTILK